MRSLYDPPEPAEMLECPECGAELIEDRTECSVECTEPECGYENGRDWDAEAEARAEARADDDPGLEVW